MQIYLTFKLLAVKYYKYIITIFLIYVRPSWCLDYRILKIVSENLQWICTSARQIYVTALQFCSWVCSVCGVLSQYCKEIQLSSPLFCLSSPKAPSAPSFIHFSELTTTSVNVSWGEPKQANGIIEGYRLVYEPCTPVDGEKLCLEPNNSAMSWHSSAGFLRQWFTTACLVTIFFFNLRCLSSRSNLLQMSIALK